MKDNTAKTRDSMLRRLKASGFVLEALVAEDYPEVKIVLRWKESTFKTALAYLGKKEEAKKLDGGFRDYIPTEAEVQAVCRELDSFGVTLVAVGCRYYEMWTMVIEEGRTLVVNTQKKGEKVRINLDEVTPSIATKIREWVFEDKYAWSPSMIRRRIHKLKQDGVLHERCVPHSFRHRKVTLLKQAGVDIEEIARSVGHCSVSTTFRYFHSNPSNQAKLTNKVLSFV